MLILYVKGMNEMATDYVETVPLSLSTALAQTGQPHTLATVPKQRDALLDELEANYEAADAAGGIAALRVAIKTLSKGADAWETEEQDSAIGLCKVKVWLAKPGIITVESNGKIVCDNRADKRKRFRAGEWLNVIDRAYQAMLTAARQEKLNKASASREEVEDLIETLTADV